MEIGHDAASGLASPLAWICVSHRPRTRSARSAVSGSRRTTRTRGRRTAHVVCRRVTRAKGFAPHLEWERELFDARWAVVSWPEEYGGRDATADGVADLRGGVLPRGRAAARHARTASSCWRRPSSSSVRPSSRTASCRAWPPAEDLWCQGWSEPNAGSDLAGIQSRGVRDDAAGGWRLTGQKTWTTRGAFCTHLFGLFRTDPDGRAPPRPDLLPRAARRAGRHRARLRPPRRRRGLRRGVPRRRVRRPTRDVLGGVNEGWSVAMATTGSERGLTLRSPGRFTATAARLLDLDSGASAARRSDPRCATRSSRRAIDAEAYRLADARAR